MLRGQGRLPPQAPRRCAWCSREFAPQPGANNAKYCPEGDCHRLAKAKRMRDYHARRRGVGTAPAPAGERPRHPFLAATDAAETALTRGIPLAVVLARLRLEHDQAFADVIRWALAERAQQQQGPGPRGPRAHAGDLAHAARAS